MLLKQILVIFIIFIFVHLFSPILEPMTSTHTSGIGIDGQYNLHGIIDNEDGFPTIQSIVPDQSHIDCSFSDLPTYEYQGISEEDMQALQIHCSSYDH